VAFLWVCLLLARAGGWPLGVVACVGRGRVWVLGVRMMMMMGRMVEVVVVVVVVARVLHLVSGF